MKALLFTEYLPNKKKKVKSKEFKKKVHKIKKKLCKSIKKPLKMIFLSKGVWVKAFKFKKPKISYILKITLIFYICFKSYEIVFLIEVFF